MCTKSYFRLLVAALFGLVCGVSSFAQSYSNWGDLERARAQQIQRQREMERDREYNERAIAKGVNYGNVVDYEKFETAKCPVFFRGGLTMGLSQCATLGYDASVGLQIGGFKGFIFCPEIGIGTRGIDDEWGDILECMTADIRTTNITVRPLQVGYSIFGGDQAVSAYGGLYASYVLGKNASYKPSKTEYYYFEGSEAPLRSFDLGASLCFDAVIYQRVDFSIVFDFSALSMFTHDVANYHWCDVMFRVGFWL